MSEPGYTATVHPSTASIPAEVWNSLAPGENGRPHNPFLDQAFFLALEEAGCATGRTGWQAQHVLLNDAGGQPVGLMPLFLKSHSMGEYVFDHGWANAYERAGGSYYPKLQSSVPFTPVTAPKFLVPSGSLEVQAHLLAAAQQLALQRNASSVHATFVPESEAMAVAAQGWLQRVDTQFHWYNHGFSTFEDFLGTLSSRKRKTIRRERRDALADGITVKWLTGSDLEEHHWDAFYEFYEDTGSRKWGRPYLNRRFFSLLNQTMADRIVLMLAYDGATPIAGALNFVGNDRILGRNWGCTRDVPFLHFELCYYQAIDYAIAHKLARGYEPTPTYSVHWITHAGLRDAIADFLERERVSVAHEQEVLDRYTPFRKGERSDQHQP